MHYTAWKKTNNKLTHAFAAVAIGIMGVAPIALPTLVSAKGGVKTPAPVEACDPITQFSAVDGDYVGGYAIFASFQEQQCVSGKTRVKISGINTSTGRTEFSTPTDFDKSLVYFYGVRRATTYEIKITIHSDRDGSLLGTKSVFVTTRDL